jgi:hypothetical protein
MPYPFNEESTFMTDKHKPEGRAFLSIVSAMMLLFLALSGTALYMAPPCSVADRIGWRLLFLSKDGWETVHISFALAFVLIMPFHLWLNWKPFVSYFTREEKKAPALSRTACIAAAVTAIFLYSPRFRCRRCHGCMKPMKR